MKNLFLTLALIILSTNLFAQAQNDSLDFNNTNLSKLYLNFGYGFGNGQITSVGLNFVYLNNWGFSFRFSQLERTKNNDDKYLHNEMAFLISREFPTKTKWINFGVEGGLSFNSQKEQVKSYPSVNATSGGGGSGISSGGSGLFGGVVWTPSTNNWGSNNSSGFTAKEYEIQRALGLIIRAKINFPLTKILGLEIAAVSNLNKFQSFYGVELHLIAGWLARK